MSEIYTVPKRVVENREWAFWTYQGLLPGHKFVSNDEDDRRETEQLLAGIGVIDVFNHPTWMDGAIGVVAMLWTKLSRERRLTVSAALHHALVSWPANTLLGLEIDVNYTITPHTAKKYPWLRRWMNRSLGRNVEHTARCLSEGGKAGLWPQATTTPRILNGGNQDIGLEFLMRRLERLNVADYGIRPVAISVLGMPPENAGKINPEYEIKFGQILMASEVRSLMKQKDIKHADQVVLGVVMGLLREEAC